MHNILVSNIGFCSKSPNLLKELQNFGNVFLNTEGIRYTEKDFIEHISDADVLIAGTEKITRSVIEHAPHLKLIARVGVGVDSIDLEAAKEKKISISYTPDAPSEAVPEFTLALILNLLKQISASDRKMHQKIWHRPMGHMLSSLKVGIVGAGKIGAKIIQLIKLIVPSSDILFYDPYVEFTEHATKCSIEHLFRESDLISLHLPLNAKTKGLVGGKLLSLMKKESYFVNTSRGGIVDESILYQMLKSNHLAGAAIDVFETEPYQGRLTELENCLLTSHLGSLAQEVRDLMEEQVVEDVVRFLKGEPLLRPLNEFNFTRC